ncbi:circularly permuted type 2 ATP-grasp protein [Sulfurirhabdus autotrophica]|uniref:Putative circularly permuted ATP-grasp superfamily protein n=1 Tax=Sulfurirhabdus autotrophica TaxID=1706046 RepID=A0A4V2W0R9_9PROT|nr:circularly permuted type 2 ATP-grasp protein [Sulfurirhabdus autotrophica]TCV79282.1 putative circularly permuted ATP-grasp superfamily protein [Sulfurirhabdus autotrophica]
MTSILSENHQIGPDQWYSTAPDSYDEMLGSNGQIRPHWEYLIRALRTLGTTEFERRGAEAAKLLRENGVTYNVYSDPAGKSRPWQLDPVPLLVSSEEWSGIESGLMERAELLNLILADIYGPRELIRKGLLPLELIYNHGGFLRACDQIALRGKHQLVIYAADLARGPDERMWVLGDRTQAPSGAGYALENRVAMTRVLPSLFRDSHVHRLALFFQSLRAGLSAIASPAAGTPRVVVLTPGPFNETFFEHAYLASYLGYPLVQGDDLTVRDGYLWLKSLNGLQRVDVILRRVDDDFCDPLELREDSRLGVPGLLEVVRSGNVAIANPLGSGVLENPGLLAFLPGIAEHFLGRRLRLPSAATWWCGQPKEMDFVLANLHKLVIKPTYRSPGMRPVFGNLLSQQEVAEWRDRIRAHPAFYVGQEQEGFSTMPSLVAGSLEPRHAVLRSFLVARADGYVVMPGGLTRSAPHKDEMLVFNQAGSISKDTWVLASEPELAIDLVVKPTPDQVAASQSGALPSRAADNLFWVGRYAERAEGTIRLLRSTIKKLNGDPDHSVKEYTESLHCLLRSITQLTGTQPGFLGEDAQALLNDPEAELLSVALDDTRIGSLANTLRCLVQTGYAVRDLWSSDTWRVMDDLEEYLLNIKQMVNPTLWQVQDVLDQLVTSLAAFSGMVMENMTRGSGWLFLDMGRRMERGVVLLSLLRTTLAQERAMAVEIMLIEALLETNDNLIYYRQHYRNNMELHALLELLLLDESNPRSLTYQTGRLVEHVAKLPREKSGGRLSLEQRLALEASTALRLVEMDELTAVTDSGARQNLDQLLSRLNYLLGALSEAVTAAYFRHESAPQSLTPLRKK